ncbi:bifunctional aspartate kinase/homoserine dehydrogenase II [Celerinatantimonas diazotrophica]|uniref:Bifunctional aspartokinase/homoserine dehydrogenase n=1 Tax=Celerinatantimonas diazotrophica TaxID=412034 RepID=A0A4R1J8B5_9GAMM|nr:bifunctional aspartate kinase/homoserine dehydrogenase II [Celerinatantimonas diazotrophica]TCK46825.1 aspartate kinase [Celerinatantimonas diazotrophica]CAG9295528.1 Bifunctional aspartokinase/homoserine dehydrogenase 2 [Celerinatantimonas diazotrophica]
MSIPQRHVHKFGGSSLADKSCFQRVVEIIVKYTQPGDLIVVSAAGKTTNRLLELLELAGEQESSCQTVFDSLYSFQHELISELLQGDWAEQLLAELASDRIVISQMLRESLDEFARNEILSFGERWSARLLSALLNQSDHESDYLDSREFFVAPNGVQPQVDVRLSQPKLAALLAAHPISQRLVVTGFIARDIDGHTITLGRNGSDYSATELAALADAQTTTIWSDVAGIFSADPRRVREAQLLDKISLAEAAELSHIGASVLHVRSLEPLFRSRQKLTLRSSYTPEEGMTQVLRVAPGHLGARIVSALDDVCLIDVHDTNESHCAMLLEHLSAIQLLPLSYSKRRDCQTLRLVYTQELYSRALAAVEQWAGEYQFYVQGLCGYSLLALVGRGVSEHRDHSRALYQVLSSLPITFVQSADSTHSLVAVLPKTTLDPLLNELHQTLFSQPRRIGLMLFGKGNIGRQWLELFAQQREVMEQRYHLRLILAGVFGRQGGVVDFHGLDPETVLHPFTPKPVVWSQLLERVSEHPFDELVAIDMTASDELSLYYPQVAQLGVHLITANKYAGSAKVEFYQHICQQFRDHGGQWLYNATVGAGLPVQSSIKMLRDAGDEIREISGIFSGTLSWLFQNFDGSVPFSQLLRQAWEQGLTEPDPREDLSGQDVARKLLILAREAGYMLENSQIQLHSLVPESLQSIPVDEFMARISELDTSLLEQLNTAQSQQQVIRYVAKFTRAGIAEIGLQSFDVHHPFANLRPCDNVFAIQSNWYCDNPLVIQGPGAGREVTAGAVQSDLVSLCQLLC